MNQNSKGNVLMFYVSFFGYENKIADTLRSWGYHVDMYDQRLDNGVVGKTCIRYGIRAYKPVIRKYLEQIIAQNRQKQYDYIFVIKGESLDEEMLDLLRAAYPKAQQILYLWDSVKNVRGCETRMKKYDRVLTFDSRDAEEYDLIFRPLFFGKEYEAAPAENQEYEYDFSFIGTAHTCRPRVVRQLGQERREKGRQFFSFLYLPHPLVFAYNKLFNRDYRMVKKSDICFAPMNVAQIKTVYQKSKCILDVEHQNQRGLTMRTIELVGMQKKIITTNALVKEYDFYHPANIYVIDREHPVVDDNFWDQEYEPVAENILAGYSLETFLREIFDIKETKHGD